MKSQSYAHRYQLSADFFVGEGFTCPGEVHKTKPDALPFEFRHTVETR
jgi:hypothetical protein